MMCWQLKLHNVLPDQINKRKFEEIFYQFKYLLLIFKY